MLTVELVICFVSLLWGGLSLWQVTRFFRWEGEYQSRLALLDAEWRKREAEWRAREHAMVDRLLKQANIQPVTPKVEVEKVIKLPDPELPTDDWVSQAFRMDEIKEIAEWKFPSLASLSAIEIQSQYPDLWREAEQAHREMNMPLRAA